MIIDINFFNQTHNFFKDVSKEYLLPNLGNLQKNQVLKFDLRLNLMLTKWRNNTR